MKWSKISALMFRDTRVMLNSKYRVVEIFYFPITTIIIWGFFNIYAQSFALEAGLMILIVNIFWNFALLTQSSVNQLINEDVWSGSLKHVLLSGISEFEYLISRIISSSFFSVIILAAMLFMGFSWFGLGAVYPYIGTLGMLSLITIVASIGLSVLVAALFIFAGRDYSFLAWTFLQIFILFSAPFYSLDVYPEPIRTVSLFMPFTRVFEAVRGMTSGMGADSVMLSDGLIVAAVYVAVSLPLYYLSFQRARRKGSLAKME